MESHKMEFFQNYEQDDRTYNVYGYKNMGGRLVPHGNGSIKYPKGHERVKYQGQFVHGKKEGYGVLTWRDGGIYKGEFKNDQQSGWGTYERIIDKKQYSGEEYTGNWLNGNKSGRGQEIYDDYF